MIYSWLASQEITAHLLFSSKESEHIYQMGIEGTKGAREFLRYNVKKAIDYTAFANETQLVTDKLKQYIDVHFQEDIRRDALAELVYLNPDYISRVFKKKVGVSISTYLMQKRVEEAKKLLTKSSLPINTISIYVGYSNFSYFTKMFRENTVYSPLEYRKAFQ